MQSDRPSGNDVSAVVESTALSDDTLVTDSASEGEQSESEHIQESVEETSDAIKESDVNSETETTPPTDSTLWDFEKGFPVFAGHMLYVTSDDTIEHFHSPLLVHAQAVENVGAQVLFHVCFEACGETNFDYLSLDERDAWVAYMQELGIPIEFLFEYEHTEPYPQASTSAFYHAYLSYADMQQLAKTAETNGYYLVFRFCTYDEIDSDLDTIELNLAS